MQRPTGVIVCVVLFVLGGLFALLAGAVLFTGSSALASFPGFHGAGGPALPQGMDGETAKTMVKGILRLLGLVALLGAGLDFLVAWGIYNLQNWGRIVGIILAVLTLINFPIGTVIGLVMLYFLILDKNTVSAFR